MELAKKSLNAFSCILRNGACTRAKLCEHLGVGAVTAGKYVQDLLDIGMIREVGYSESSGGRKPILYSVNDSVYFILSINISTIYCEVAVCDFNLKIRNSNRFKIHADDLSQNVIDRIILVYSELKRNLGLSDDSFIGAGVILFGTVKDESGVMYKPILGFSNDSWEGFPVLDIIREKIKLPVYHEKGITATASLEYNYGVGKNHNSMLYVLCATHIRSVFVINGMVQGHGPFYEDAFGHMVVEYDGTYCHCGQYGCINCYASIPAIINDVRSKIKRGKRTSIDTFVDEISIEEVCKFAKEGDPCCVEAISSAAEMLGIALANYVRVTSPDVVVISGLLCELSSMYYETVVCSTLKHLGNTCYVNTEFCRIGSFNNPLTTSGASVVIDKIFGF